MPRSSELAKGEFVMVFIVQDIYEGGQEGVKILIPTRTIRTQNISRKAVNAHRA